MNERDFLSDVAAAGAAECDRLREQNNRRAGTLLRLISILGDAPIRTESGLPDAVAELIAERDHLRAGIMAAEVHGELIVRMRESVWREFEAERDRLRDELEQWGRQSNENARQLMRATGVIDAVRVAFVRTDDDWRVNTDALVGLANALDALDNGEDIETEQDRLRVMLVNTATDARILRRARAHGNASVADMLIDQICERLAPFDVGDVADG